MQRKVSFDQLFQLNLASVFFYKIDLCKVIAVLETWRQECPWASHIRYPSLLGEFQASERPASEKSGHPPKE